MTIDQALDLFLTQLRADGRSDHTVGQYRRHVRFLARWAGDARHTGAVGDLSHEDLARFLASPVARLSARGGAKRAGSLNALRTSIKGFFSYLHRAGYIAHDPSRVLRQAHCGRPPPRALSAEERSRLLAVLSEAEGAEARRDHALVHLMLGAGLRLGSALALDVEDLDLERGEVNVCSAKGDRPERVFLADAVREHLRRYVGDRSEGALFRARDGRRVSRRHVQRRISGWLARAGVRRASAHSLRHTFAQDLYRRTGDILLVKEALRHRSIASTLVYARADEERVRQALG